MLERSFLIAIVASLALLAGPAFAQEARKFSEVDTVTVSKIETDPTRLTVESNDGPKTYVVEPVTRVYSGTDPVEFASVRVGDRVVVEANDEIGDGRPSLIADRIVIVVDKPAGE